MKQIIRISGKAKQVFNYLDLLNRHRGSVTIGKLAKNNKILRLDLRSQ